MDAPSLTVPPLAVCRILFPPCTLLQVLPTELSAFDDAAGAGVRAQPFEHTRSLSNGSVLPSVAVPPLAEVSQQAERWLADQTCQEDGKAFVRLAVRPTFL
jgi:hypothetical protein